MKSIKEELDDEFVTAREISIETELLNLQNNSIHIKKEEKKKTNEFKYENYPKASNIAYIPKTPNHYQFRVNKNEIATPQKKKNEFQFKSKICDNSPSVENKNVIFHSNINFNFMNTDMKGISPYKFSRQYPPDIVEVKKKDKHLIFFQHLAKMQEFSLGNPITTAEFDKEGIKLAIGLENGNLIVIQKGNFANQSAEKLFDKESMKIFSKHNLAINYISWSKNNYNFISSSSENFVILWDINDEKFYDIYIHPGHVTGICFFPNNDLFFASACSDKNVRIWNIKETMEISIIKLEYELLAVEFCPNSNFFIVGTKHGKCIALDYNGNQLQQLEIIECKNRKGLYSKGKPVIGIKFLDEENVLLSTLDNRIRLFNCQKKKQTCKFIGCKNKKSLCIAKISHDSKYIIQGSTKGKVCLWNLDLPSINENIAHGWIHDRGVEYFNGFDSESKATFTLFASKNIVNEVSNELNQYSNPTKVDHIIIAGSNKGTIRVFYKITNI